MYGLEFGNGSMWQYTDIHGTFPTYLYFYITPEFTEGYVNDLA